MAAPLDASKGGSKLKFKTAKELQDVIDEYFRWCDNRTKNVYIKEAGDNVPISFPAPYTMSGLARRLGITRQTLVNYGNRELFFDTVREARDKVQEDVETRLMETTNQSGAQFNLKNNFGWKDKTEQDLTTNGESLNTALVQFIDGSNKDKSS